MSMRTRPRLAKPVSDHQGGFDFKDVETLQRFLSPQGRILSAKRTGLTARQQRQLKKAIKYARFLSLLPYTN